MLSLKINIAAKPNKNAIPFDKERDTWHKDLNGRF